MRPVHINPVSHCLTVTAYWWGVQATAHEEVLPDGSSPTEPNAAALPDAVEQAEACFREAVQKIKG